VSIAGGRVRIHRPPGVTVWWGRKLVHALEGLGRGDQETAALHPESPALRGREIASLALQPVLVQDALRDHVADLAARADDDGGASEQVEAGLASAAAHVPPLGDLGDHVEDDLPVGPNPARGADRLDVRSADLVAAKSGMPGAGQTELLQPVGPGHLLVVGAFRRAVTPLSCCSPAMADVRTARGIRSRGS